MAYGGRAILAVDDKETNLEILTGMLRPAGYHVATASDGHEAWELLQSSDHHFKAVLLDRIMPRMNGMEVLQKMKGHPALKSIPVIMQTSAGAAHEVVEGIQAGAYYYLTKPFKRKILLGIVQAAIRDYEGYQLLQEEVRQNARSWGFLESGIFRFRSLTEARDLATLLANACPEPSRAVLGLVELFINAVEHGNLGISYEEKSQFDEEEKLEQEIARRLSLPAYAHKTVEVVFRRQVDAIQITVTDQGNGFDWQDFLTFDANRAFDSHGRGIAMAKMLSFDSLEYRGIGNQVVCTISLSPTSVPEVPAPVEMTMKG